MWSPSKIWRVLEVFHCVSLIRRVLSLFQNLCSTLPYPLSKTKGSATFIVYRNRSVFDATSLYMFLEDLGNVIINEHAKLAPRASYGHFANTFYSHRASAQSQISVKHHITRLKGIGELRDALWPARYSPSGSEKLGNQLQTRRRHFRKVVRSYFVEGEEEPRAGGLHKTHKAHSNE